MVITCYIPSNITPINYFLVALLVLEILFKIAPLWTYAEKLDFHTTMYITQKVHEV